MGAAPDLERRMEALQDRLTRLSEASLRINETTEFEPVLQGVLDSARSLVEARCGVLTVLDESGRVESFLSSGLSPDEARRLWEMPGGADIHGYLSGLPGPLRVSDFASYASSMGLPEFLEPAPLSALLMVPIRRHGHGVGTIFVARSRPGEEFTRQDEEILVLFASQAALVIANARRHRDERQARAELETVIDTSPVGIAVFDARTGAPVSFNREVRRLMDQIKAPGQSPEELLEVMTVRSADGRAIDLADFSVVGAMSAGETVRLEEFVLEVPDGRSVTVLLSARPIRAGADDIATFVVTLQDMKPLQDLDRMRAEFLGMVSHELRTPLASIRGSATTVLDAWSEMDSAEMRQFVRIIVEQADRMRDLVGGLLDVARMETGTLPVSPEPCRVEALVDAARSTFAIGGGRDSLEIDLAPDLPLVMADRRRIVQVIGNLLSNAARHSPESSPIKVAAARDGVHVAVSVADEGRGIPSESLPRLFQKFSMGTGDQGGGGTGLGLAICRGVVEAHGGRIWAESGGPGLGARFTFTIPAAATPAAEEAGPGRPPRPEAGGQPVLVVDDDPQTLAYVRKALSDAGYDPVVTADPGEALRLMRDGRPHLVLLDMILPGSDGIELMADILRIADVPVVFLSAYGRDQTIAQALDAGAADYIVKPFSPTELVARVGAALRRREEPSRAGAREPYVLGDLTVDHAERVVTAAGRRVRLTATEYDLLHMLAANAGRVVTHEQLMRHVWGHERYVDVGTVRTVVKRLRRKLGDDARSPRYIFAEYRVGYRMAGGDAREGEGE